MPPQGSGNIQNLTTYYSPNTGYETSGTTSNVSNIGTYNYTVPFQTYQLNPGATINMAVGQTVTQMLANGNDAYAGEKITLPAGWTSNGATSGTIQEVGHIENIVYNLGLRLHDHGLQPLEQIRRRCGR